MLKGKIAGNGKYRKRERSLQGTIMLEEVRCDVA